jgi:uncharacterized membrane protein
MTTLSVYIFDTPHAAERKAQILEARPGHRVSTDDAAVITWPETANRPTAWQASPLGARNTLTGAFWGLLFAHLLLLPLSYSEPPTSPSNSPTTPSPQSG